MEAVNKIDEFKYRIRQDKVVLHDIVSPNFTVLNTSDQYVFCHTEFTSDFKEFYNRVKNSIEVAMNGDNLEDEPNKDDLVFISPLPWISYTAVTHPIDTDNPDSFPRITFGRYFQENDRIKLPFSVSVHHGLCDGLHIAKLLREIEMEIVKLNKN